MQITFSGKIITGAKRGKLLGFPTANILLNEKIEEGIYISEIQIDDEHFHGATFIGSAKTFGETDYKAEVYILDFDDTIYEKLVTVTLFKKIRDNEKFSGEKELITQMEKDVKEVRKYFAKS